MRIGLEHVQGKIVIIQDADLELSPAEIPKLIKPIQDGQAEVVFGSRFLGRVAGLPFLPRLGNKLLTLTTNLLYGSRIIDMETCYKACRASVITRIKLDSSGFEIEPELTAKLLRLGYRIHEIPISYRPRKRFEGKKINWKDGVKAIYYLFKYRFQDVRTFVREPCHRSQLSSKELVVFGNGTGSSTSARSWSDCSSMCTMCFTLSDF